MCKIARREFSFHGTFWSPDFVLVSWLMVANTIYKYPADSLLGVLILFVGLPRVCFLASAATLANRLGPCL